MTRTEATRPRNKVRLRSRAVALRKSSRPSSSAASGWRSNIWIYCFLLAAGTLALYGQVLGHDFIRLDDEGYVTHNAHVKAGLTWQTLKWALTSTEQANWHPVTWLSHSLDFQLFGMNPAGHHLVSALIHLTNVLLLFFLLRRLTGAAGSSFVVAALFAWHPFNVESVAWIAERKNVLSTLFFLFALWAYSEYARKPRWKPYLALVTFFTLGLAAKPMLVTLPFVLLLLDFWPLQRVQAWLPPSQAFPVRQAPFWSLVVEKLPLAMLSAVSSVVTMVAQRRSIAAPENLPLALRFTNAFYSYAMYVWKAFVPSGFALYYPHPFVSALNRKPGIGIYLWATVGAVLLVSVSVMIWRFRLRRPYLVTGWFWFVGTLVPVIGIVQVGMQAMADRYAYVPLIGLFIMAAWSAAHLADRSSAGSVLLRTGTAVVLVLFWVLAFRQVGAWRSGVDIWGHTLEVTEDNFVADDNMADALMRLGRPESLQYFEEAARIAPRDGVSHGAIAAYLEDQGRLQEAIQQYEVVIQNPPSAEFLAFAQANLGIAYTELGDAQKASVEFQKALSTDRHALDEMIDSLVHTVSVHPSDEAYLRLALLLEQTNRMAEARAACEGALKIKPQRPEALNCIDRLKTAGT